MLNSQMKYNKKALVFLTTTLAISLLAACDPGPPAKKTSPVDTFSPLDEKTATCESSLRQQMQKKSLNLVSIPELKNEITEMQREVQRTSSIIYSVKKNTQIIGFQIEHIEEDPRTYSKILKFTLYKNDKDSTDPMKLDIKIETTKGGAYKNLEQEFGVSANCELRIMSTTQEIVMALGGTTHRYQKDTFYYNGEKQNAYNEFTHDQKVPLLNYIPRSDDLWKYPRRAAVYINDIGIADIDTSDAPETKVEEFGMKLRFKNKKSQVTFQGKHLITMNQGKDPEKGISVLEAAGQKTWTVPKELWESLALGTSGNANALVKSELQKDYLENNASLQLVTNKMPSYENFRAYWSVTAKTVDEASGVLTLSLTENPEPQTISQTIPADLATTDTIQTQLPQVQKIAQAILAKSPSNRHEQIQGILNYLADHYTYDYEMLKNNVIRPLTTQEALERKTGVCQHYAVIFVAVARAMKIPSRIIVGYALSDQPGGHAWVEAEIQPNVWRVIEPQSRKGLERTYTRGYFPFARGSFLENKKSVDVTYFNEMTSTQLLFKPSH